METYIYKVFSAKGVHVVQLNQELLMIAKDYYSKDYPNQTQLVPAFDYVRLTTTNHKLIDALIKDEDFMLTEIK